MTYEKQHYISDLERKYSVERTRVLLNQPDGGLLVQCTFWIGHEPLGENPVWIDRETLDSLSNFARLGHGGSLGLTSAALTVLDHFDVWTDATPDGIRLSADNEFFVWLYNSVEGELFDEAAALDLAVA